MHKIKLMLVIFIATACGGGGGGGDNTTPTAQATTTTTSTSDSSSTTSTSDSSSSIGDNDYVASGTEVMATSGKVIDGYLQNTRVFIDVNFDGIWAGSDDHELSAVTDANGLYQFDATAYNANKACYDKRPRIAIVDENSIDVSSGAVTKPYKLMFMPNVVGVTQSYIDEQDVAHTNLTPYTSVYSILIAKAKASLISSCTGTSKACYLLRKELSMAKTGALLGDQCAAGSTSDKLATEIDTIGAQNAAWISTFLRTAGLPKVSQSGSTTAIDPGYDFIEKNETTLSVLASESTKLFAIKESINQTLDTYFETVYGGSGNLVGTSVDFSQETIHAMLTPSKSLNTLNGSGLFTDDMDVDLSTNWEWKDEVTINRLKTTDYKDLVQGSCEEGSSSDKCGELDSSKFPDILKSAASVKIYNKWESPNCTGADCPNPHNIENSGLPSDVLFMLYYENFSSWWGVDETCLGTCPVELDFPERTVLPSDTYHCSQESVITFNVKDRIAGRKPPYGTVTALQYIDDDFGCPARTDKLKRVDWTYQGDDFNYTHTGGEEQTQQARDSVMIWVYSEEGDNISINFPAVDKTKRDTQEMFDWITYAKTLPTHFTETDELKLLFNGNTDQARFDSRRLINGKNMNHQYSIRKDGDNWEESCLKYDETGCLGMGPNSGACTITDGSSILTETINGATAHNACFGTFEALN